jgi:hypothetical protein
VIEYGATAGGPGRLTITATPSNKALFRMTTVADLAPRVAGAPPADFDPFRAYQWAVIRPGTAAGFNRSSGTNDPAEFADFTTENAAAGISITDALTGLSVSGSQLTDPLLNEYLGFDASGWDWGSLPPTLRGQFSFALAPDSQGTSDRMIELVYTPSAVPEPGTLLLAGLAAAAGLARCRRRRVWPKPQPAMRQIRAGKQG